jgi:hypothetical protein
MILMKLLIRKSGGERRTETVCGCVQLKDPSVNHLDLSTELNTVCGCVQLKDPSDSRLDLSTELNTVCGCIQLKDPSVNHLDLSTEYIHGSFSVLLSPPTLCINNFIRITSSSLRMAL